MAVVLTFGVAIDPGTVFILQHLGSGLSRKSQRTANDINQLEAGSNMRMENTALDPRQKVRNARNNISIRRQNAHAVRNQERIQPFPNRKADSILRSSNTKDSFLLRAQEIGEVLLEHQGNPRRFSRLWAPPSGLQLRKEPRRKPALLPNSTSPMERFKRRRR